MNNKRLMRSADAMIGGVCGGLADYFELDRSLMRILWAVAFFVFGAGFLAYIICWIILPKEI